MDSQPTAKFDATKYVPALLSTLNNRLTSGASDMYLKTFGVGINEWRILTVMAQAPECSAKYIADEAAIHLTVISRSLRNMATKGLVQIDSTTWQRSLTLTELGLQMYQQISQVALRREALLLNGVDSEEVALLQNLLRRLTANIELVENFDPGILNLSLAAKPKPHR